MVRLIRWIASGAALTALALAPVADAAPAAQKKAAAAAQRDTANDEASKFHDLVQYRTRTFSVYLPEGWTIDRKRPSKDGMGSYVIASEDRGAKAYVRVGHLRDEDLRSLWLRYAEESLGKYVGKLHIQSYDQMKVNDATGLAFGTVYGVTKRKRSAQMFKFAVMAVRNVLRGRILYMAVGGDGDNWRSIARHLPVIIRSANLQ